MVDKSSQPVRWHGVSRLERNRSHELVVQIERLKLKRHRRLAQISGTIGDTEYTPKCETEQLSSSSTLAAVHTPISRQIAQALKHPHHGPCIPLTIVEKVLPHAVPFCRIDSVRHKEQPRDLDARHQPIHDHQIAVREIGHQRLQHVLDAEAAAKVRVIDVVPNDREQINQLPP